VDFGKTLLYLRSLYPTVAGNLAAAFAFRLVCDVIVPVQLKGEKRFKGGWSLADEELGARREC
jgi:hypothetical protein